MKKIEDNELKLVKGGFGFWGFAGLVSLGIFIVGIIDGIARPVSCN